MKVGRFARWYRLVEYLAFGRALETYRFAFLHYLKSARRIVTFGEGDGRALERLLHAAPTAHIDVVEASGDMIALAKLRVDDSPRVRFYQEDVLNRDWSKRGYDAVMTLFFLDCFETNDARRLVGQIARSLSPGALWLLSDFAIPESGWRQIHAKAWLFVMYRFFKTATGLQTRRLPDMRSMLEENGFTRLRCRETRSGLIRAEVWQMPGSP